MVNIVGDPKQPKVQDISLRNEPTVFINLAQFIQGFTVGIADPLNPKETKSTNFKDMGLAIGEMVAIIRDTDISQVLIYGFVEQRDEVASMLSGALDKVLPEKSKEVNIFFNSLNTRSGY